MINMKLLNPNKQDCRDRSKSELFSRRDLSNFVTCAERLPCHASLKPVVQATIKLAEDEEIKKKCRK